MSEKAAPILRTIKLRLRDRHISALKRKARAVNFVWNYCNEVQMKAAKSGRRWLSAYDLQKLTAGSSKLLNLHSNSIGAVCEYYVHSRKTANKPWLRFRGRRSLGWVPYKGLDLQKRNGAFVYRSETFSPLHDRTETDAPKYSAGSFNADARGHWYINVCVAVEQRAPAPAKSVGIDLGLKELVALSTGETYENPKQFAQLSERLGKAQRANKRRLALTINTKIKNARSDFLHKLSNQITSSHNVIVVGNVSSKALGKTRFAKSVYDAGWATLRRQIAYKAITHGAIYAEVNESWTSQTCSMCGCLPASRPKGIAGLGIRQFDCSECGASLNRDVNAARNILARFSQEPLAEGAGKAAGAGERERT